MSHPHVNERDLPPRTVIRLAHTTAKDQRTGRWQSRSVQIEESEPQTLEQLCEMFRLALNSIGFDVDSVEAFTDEDGDAGTEVG